MGKILKWLARKKSYLTKKKQDRKKLFGFLCLKWVDVLKTNQNIPVRKNIRKYQMKIKKFKYFYPEKPMLIQIDQDCFEQMSNDPKYVAEPKINGARCEVHIFYGEVEFWDRHGKKLDFDSNPLYKEGRDKIKKILIESFGDKGYFNFDGELRHNKVTGIQCKLALWDCFISDHELLNKMKYWARRAFIASSLVCKDDTVRLLEQHKDNFRNHYNAYVLGEHGNPDEFEGLVIKNVNGMLNLSRTSGMNSNWMYKVRKQTGRHRY